jgi:hypothetical protein
MKLSFAATSRVQSITQAGAMKRPARMVSVVPATCLPVPQHAGASKWVPVCSPRLMLFGGARAQLLKGLFVPGSRVVGAETRRRNDAQRLDLCGAGDGGLLVEQNAAKTLGFGLVN